MAPMNSASLTAAEKTAARAWLAHLRSRPVQERALTLGFRPGDTSVPVKTLDPRTPSRAWRSTA